MSMGASVGRTGRGRGRGQDAINWHGLARAQARDHDEMAVGRPILVSRVEVGCRRGSFFHPWGSGVLSMSY